MDNDFKGWKTIENELGRGGQGKIEKVQKENIVAAKKIVPFGGDSEKKARFVREIKAIKEIAHPNVIKILVDNCEDLKDSSDSGIYIMPFAKYGSLADHKSLFENNIELSLKIFLKICLALHEAHKKIPPIIHRDISMENVLFIDAIIEPVLSDFGLCFDDNARIRLTDTEEILGPKGQKAPEQEIGRDEQPSIQTDIYQLGKLLYRMLSGGKKLERENFRENNRNLSSIYQDSRYELINDLFDKMIVYAPERRISSVLEICDIVEQIIKNKFVFHLPHSHLLRQKLASYQTNHDMANFRLELDRILENIFLIFFFRDYSDLQDVLSYVQDNRDSIDDLINIVNIVIENKGQDMTKIIIEKLQEMTMKFYKNNQFKQIHLDLNYFIVSIVYNSALCLAIKHLDLDILSVLLRTNFHYCDNMYTDHWTYPFHIKHLWFNRTFIGYSDRFNFILDYLRQHKELGELFNSKDGLFSYYIKSNYILCLVEAFDIENGRVTGYPIQYFYFRGQEENIEDILRLFNENEEIRRGFAEKIFIIPLEEFFLKINNTQKLLIARSM